MKLDPLLEQRLGDLRRRHLQRHLRRIEASHGIRVTTAAGERINFSSNDYLGLARHPALHRAASEASERWGAGSTASRLVCGSFEPHHQLEEDLARFKQTEAAIAFATGYAAALGTVPALVGPGDHVVVDRLSHACLVDAARLSRAHLRVFRHNDIVDLRRILDWVNRQRRTAPDGPSAPQALVITESVFSMDGDRAPLRAIADAASEAGAWLMVDEAHATGLIGPTRRGLVEELDLTGRVEIQMGTLGKALGTSGGFIAGSQALCQHLLHQARSYVFSTATPPAAAAAARAAVGIVHSEEGADLTSRFWSRLETLHAGLKDLGWDVPPPLSGILPLMVGPEEDAVRLAAALDVEGFLVPAIRFPTVPRGRARLRVTISAAHEIADIGALLVGLRRAMDKTGVRPSLRPETEGDETAR